MSGKWFANRGQELQIATGFAALILGILVALPRLPLQQGLDGLLSAWPIIIFPLVALGLMWLNNQRTHRTIETLIQKTPQVSTTSAATTIQPDRPTLAPADLFPTPSTVGNSWSMTAADVVDVRVKVGSYRDEPLGRDKMRISVIAIHEEPGRRSAELHVRSGGSIVYGGGEANKIATNRYKVTLTSSGIDAEEQSIYQFSFDGEHIHFFAIRVDGLDTAIGEAALQIAKFRAWNHERA
jgi:hypothetical protein